MGTRVLQFIPWNTAEVYLLTDMTLIGSSVLLQSLSFDDCKGNREAGSPLEMYPLKRQPIKSNWTMVSILVVFIEAISVKLRQIQQVNSEKLI